jgi:hypothetical protein
VSGVGHGGTRGDAMEFVGSRLAVQLFTRQKKEFGTHYADNALNHLCSRLLWPDD